MLFSPKVGREVSVRLLIAAELITPGCARELARSSSGAIGCPPTEIEVTDVSVGWSEMSWTARCGARTYYCAGEDSPRCALPAAPVGTKGKTNDDV